MLYPDLDGKQVVITGGASNIGRGITHCFAEQHAAITIVDIDVEKAESTRREALELGARSCAVLEADLGEPERCTRVIERAAESAGTIDVLVNNMGWGDPSLFLDSDPARWERMWKLNLGATIGCSHAALVLMRKRRQGAIVSIASDAAQGVPNQAVYGAMKAGIVALTKALAKEFGRYNVRVNAIAPGIVLPASEDDAGRGSIWRQGQTVLTDQQIQDTYQLSALKRATHARDIGNAALFFASDAAARQVTGQIISVSGGWWMP
jgi:NAD(P)-dependent dehydrogenase (short-subunit alcohol dehydrogenase family)